MDEKTTALIEAITTADECRRNDPIGRICHVCWAKVGDAVRDIDPEKIAVMFG